MGLHPSYVVGVYELGVKILESLENDGVSRGMLVGEAGIGKTWLARKVFKLAIEEGSCYMAIWLNLGKVLDEMSLYEDIASQLFLVPENEESEEDNGGDEDNIDDEREQTLQDLIRLKDQIHKELDRKKLSCEGTKYFLLVLDDEGSVTNEEKVMKDLHLGEFLAPYGPMKIILTRRKGKGSDGEIRSHAADEAHALLDSNVIDISQTLHEALTDEYFLELLEFQMEYGILKSLENLWGKDKGFLARRIVEMSMSLPAAVVVLAKSLNSIAQKLPICLSPKQEEVFKIAVLSSFPFVSNFAFVDAADRKRAASRPNPILRLVYELLKSDDTLNSSILDCFWHSLSFFEHCGCIYYQELIAHWILEGYFDPVRSVTKAYKDGYIILMELLNRRILKIQEGNMVVPEVAIKNLIDLRRRGLSGTSRIGLAKVNMTEGLGNINYVDDVIKGVRAKRKGGKITTILVSGKHLRQETPEKFFEKLMDLEILALFEPTLDPFVPSLSKLSKLRVLVIRDCDLLKDIEELKTLQGLHVLEVSGASSLKEISDGFFVAMPDLQSLHLSGLQIKYSPSSISKLKRLHRLIIRDCPVLEDLPDIQELVNLEVVDVSGARGLQTDFDKARGVNKNKNFYHLTKLKLLDFSESQIERLPMFQDSAVAAKLHSLTRLLLRNCGKLRKLSNLKPLSGLQILDLSGTTSLVRMSEFCLEDKKELIILNLSGTNLRQLPSTIKELSNLSELILTNCPNLEALPDIKNLTNLEVFDVTGCTKLHTVEGSFVDMSYLREVSLSRTKLKIPPELPKESKLCCRKRIIFADCSFLESENWGQITEAITTQMLESASCSGVVVKSQEISKMDPKEGEIHSNEPCSSDDFPGKRGISRECFRHDPIYVALYYKSIPFVDSESHLKVLEIHESNGLGGPRDLDKEALANAEFVSFVDCSSTRLTYIFNEIISAKGCWLRMCMDIKDLFSDEDDERLGSLETLSITNLPLLETISFAGSYQNLKKLSIDCCPRIKTLFPEASHLPSSLQVLHIKFCENMEIVFKEGQVSTLTTLCLDELPVLSAIGAKLPNLQTFNKENCPKLCATKEILRGSGVGHAHGRLH